MKRFFLLIILLAALTWGCRAEPQMVEVTRLVSQEVPVTVEVTRMVAQAITVEVPVEVTVMVPVEVTRPAEATAAPTPAAPTPEATAAAAAGQFYTVQSGDNMSIIAARTGVPVANILAANSLANAGFITVGQELLIPGWDGTLAELAVPVTGDPAEPAPPAAAEPLAPVGPNLLPNASFEGDWYFFNGVQEWQIAQGWALAIDEGLNTLTPEAEDLFLRPEVRVVSKANLPAKEHNLFVFDGNKTIKIFKGGAPTSFAVFTDITLEPGTYRFTINFFPDIVAAYRQGQKVWASDPMAAEVRFIQDGGGSAWVNPAPGQKNTLTYEFTLAETSTVRLGAAFRNRYVNHNNGWFLDDWRLQRLEAPQP